MIKAKTLQDLFQRYRRPGDLVFSLVFLGFSLFLLATLGSQTTWSSSKGVMEQPAFWPYVSVLSMVVFSVLHLLSGLMSPALAGRWREVGFWLRAFEFVGWFMLYVLAVPRAGYLLSTIAFCVLLSLRLGYRSPRLLLSAAAFAVAVVIVFKTLLQVKVPGGQIYELLPTAARSFMLTYF